MHKTTICIHEFPPKEKALIRTKRNIHIYDMAVFEDAPIDTTEKCKVEVSFFKIKGYTTDDSAVIAEYRARGLKPIDLYSLAHIDDSELPFTDYATVWKNIRNEWCFATFDCSSCSTGKRDIRIGKHEAGWNTRFWFAGLKE